MAGQWIHGQGGGVWTGLGNGAAAVDRTNAEHFITEHNTLVDAYEQAEQRIAALEAEVRALREAVLTRRTALEACREHRNDPVRIIGLVDDGLMAWSDG
jgi:hypothetical protein